MCNSHAPKGDSPHECTDMNGHEMNPLCDPSCDLYGKNKGGEIREKKIYSRKAGLGRNGFDGAKVS